MENRVKDLREEQGMSQEQLGRLVGVSRQTIIAIEKGKYNPSLDLAFKFKRVFNKSIEEMFIPETFNFGKF